MTNNGKLPAMPNTDEACVALMGFTKREELSARFMAAMLTSERRPDPAHVAMVACGYADALLAEWAK
jgi:hypothetical protein